MAKFVTDFGKLGQEPAPDGRLDGPAFHRNHEAIWSAIGPFLSKASGDVLEIGSGTGQHAMTFAARTPQLTWWPSDILPSHLASIAAWRAEARLANLRAPQRIDLERADWTWNGDEGSGDLLAALLCINVLHIAPWRDRKIFLQARDAFSSRVDGCSFTGRSSATVHTPRRVTRGSMRVCARRIRNGACATSPILIRSHRKPALRLPSSRPCRPTTGS